MEKFQWTTWNGYEIKLTVSKNPLRLESFELDGQVIPAEFEVSNNQEINFIFEELNSVVEIPEKLYKTIKR